MEGIRRERSLSAQLSLSAIGRNGSAETDMSRSSSPCRASASCALLPLSEHPTREHVYKSNLPFAFIFSINAANARARISSVAPRLAHWSQRVVAPIHRNGQA